MNTQPTHPVLLRQRDAAEILGVSKRTMQRLNKIGALRPVRIVGLGRPRYRLSDVERLARGEEKAP